MLKTTKRKVLVPIRNDYNEYSDDEIPRNYFIRLHTLAQVCGPRLAELLESKKQKPCLLGEQATVTASSSVINPPLTSSSEEEGEIKEWTERKKQNRSFLAEQATVTANSSVTNPPLTSSSDEEGEIKEWTERKKQKRPFLAEQATVTANCPVINPPLTPSEDEGEFKEWTVRKKRSLRTSVPTPLSIHHEAPKKNRKKKNIKKNNIKRQGPNPPPGMPAEFRAKILELAGPEAIVSEEKLLIQKELTMSDVKENQNRLSIPEKKVIEPNFLTEDEVRLLDSHDGKNVGSLDVTIIEPSLKRGLASLRKWNMHKDSGNISVSYVITTKWNEIRDRNGLKEGMIVQVWSVRVGGELWLAIVRLPDEN